eukprot:TRINITY_DN497_c0_g3_i1.p1 TRINITY_DN497_c0_g3~~TRINITY_DN497_c0_g3_i1.p1  ORF type:complete len:561 (+),score=126.23 TRINITY_DN497_c0_g3_i1:45-1727(+)
MSTVTFRVVHINDVYELDEFPHLSSLFHQAKEGADLCLLTLGGDFVSPSLMSGLDQGKGMIEVMNATGVTHVCFGNHEADIPVHALVDRISEFEGKWINTNMPAFQVKLPDHVVESVQSKDGSNQRKIALLGLNLPEPSLYRADAFGGAVKSITEVNTTAVEWKKKLEGQVDLILPMTHQGLKDDRALLEAGEFPIILGGHDHQEYFETKNGKYMFKAGIDAHKAVVIDIVWPDSSAKEPTIKYEVKNVKEHPVDPKVSAIASRHKAKLDALDKAIIYRHLGCEPLTSKGTRLEQTTIGSLICTAVRDTLLLDAVLVDGGAIRGNSDYPHGAVTLADVRKELPFSSEEMIPVTMVGKVLNEVLKFSRIPEGRAGFLQVDDRLKVDPSTQSITHINHTPFNPEKEYNVAFLYVSLTGMNNNEPLKEWTKTHPCPSSEAGRPLKNILLEYFSKLLWANLPSFDEIDTDKNGLLSKDEVKIAYEKVFSLDVDNDGIVSDTEKLAAEFVIDKIIEALNTNQDEFIDRHEYESGLGFHGTEKEKKETKEKKAKKKAKKAKKGKKE